LRDRVLKFLESKVHLSWRNLLLKAILQLDIEYLEFILTQKYLPSNGRLFSAFKTLPKENLKYILFGQDPYPREDSAIGYAFIDGKVREIFNSNGLSKDVNRATSLRNFIKMALVAKGLLDASDITKENIVKIKKYELINSIYELKDNFEKNGVLLLNTALIFEDKKRSNHHIKKWKPFIKYLLNNIDSTVELILFGNPAKKIKKELNLEHKAYEMEHPYNLSFINSKEAQELFSKMDLLSKQKSFKAKKS